MTDDTLITDSAVPNYIGMFNVNFERKTGQATYKKSKVDETGNVIYENLNKTIYYYPRNELGSYSSIVDTNNTITNTLEEYVKSLLNNFSGTKKYNLAKAYYIALGRERNGMYRVNNKLEELQEGIRIQSLGGKFENDSGKVFDYFPPGYRLDGTKINGNNHIVKE